MNNNSLKEKIQSGELTIGSWITLGNTGIAEILANAGYDWLVVDLEHTTISLEQAGELIRTIELSGVPSLVRLTSNDENQIKRVMDAGATGVVVPMVKNVEDAKSAVAAIHYPPLGNRGVGLARAQKYGEAFQEYLKWQSDANDGPVVVVQIEHIDAVNNLKNILSVEGVDAFIIGPYDLSCSMGIPGEFNNPKFKQVIESIISISNEMNAVSGLHVVEPDLLKLDEAIKIGHKFIAYSVDIRMLAVMAKSGVDRIKRQ
ncbi:2,4-dihydroxyhept-2-ene-1,7-dioic acid aldolase [bacterium]|jgi:2-dehydro-3-deoxyglucarate aldolase|nr:2,4-dihydroxyhept-2-ene-1,7-dioic acid aldolase [bacterium]